MDKPKWFCVICTFFQGFMFLHGIPGYIDDNRAWREILSIPNWTFIEWILIIGAISTGLYGTSPLWLKVFRLGRKKKPSLVGEVEKAIDLLKHVVPPDTIEEGWAMAALQEKLEQEGREARFPLTTDPDIYPFLAQLAPKLRTKGYDPPKVKHGDMRSHEEWFHFLVDLLPHLKNTKRERED